MNSVALDPTPVTQTQHKPRQLFSVTHKQALGLSLVLLAATIALYFPVIHHPFTNIDDQGYVYENLHVQDGLSWPTIKWALLTFDDNNWHPVTWFSHALDCQMFGIDPAGHHIMNAVWHADRRGGAVLGAAAGDRVSGPQLHGGCVVCCPSHQR